MPANLLGLRENPFAASHDPRLILETSERAEIVSRFKQALASNEPFVLVTGEAGVGKTSVVTQVLADEKAWSALITNPLLTRAELLEEICLRFGVDLPESVSKPRLLAELERHLTEIRREDEVPVLVVDEAHDLSLELLEELRLLSNLEFKGQPLVQIVLVGLPALEARLAQPDLAQLRQRIATHSRLRPLDAETTWRYIHHRVAAAGGDGAERFPDETCLEIYGLTRGVPRAINTLAGHALLAASRESERVVTRAHVQVSAADTWMRNVSDGAPPASSAVPAAARPAPETPRPRSKPAPGDAAPSAPSGKEAKPAPPQAAPATPAAKETKPAAKSSPLPKVSPETKPTSQTTGTEKAKVTKPAPSAPTPERKSEGEAAIEPLPPRPAGDPDVREWISRFVDPDKPLQIGVHAGLAPKTIEEFSDPASEASEEEGAESTAPPPGRRPERRPAGTPGKRRAQRDSALLTAGAVGVLAIAAAVVIVPRLHRPTSSPADSASTIAAPSAIPELKAAAVRPRKTAPRQKSTTSRAASAPVTAPQTAAPVKAEASPDSTASKRWQGIEVATYLDPYRASAESARLAELTGLSSRVIEADDRIGEAYRVVLGSFSTRRKAERVADDLIERGLIQQGSVVQLGLIRQH